MVKTQGKKLDTENSEAKTATVYEGIIM